MMKKEKLILGIVLFVLGLSGVLSMLTMDIPLPDEVLAVLLEQLTLQQIDYLKLLNPTIMLIGAVLFGVFFHVEASLDVPIIKGIINRTRVDGVRSILKYGLLGGLLIGILLIATEEFYTWLLPEQFSEVGEALQPTLVARFLYGGFTEELLMRFGLMTFFVWLLYKIFKSHDKKIYWTAIILSAILFAVSHFPVAIQSVSNPSPLFLSYILIGNSMGGIVFGWLYWKKGLESAFIGHITAHCILVLIGLL